MALPGLNVAKSGVFAHADWDALEDSLDGFEFSGDGQQARSHENSNAVNHDGKTSAITDGGDRSGDPHDDPQNDLHDDPHE
ncbi:MAG: hypothetical protein AAGI72_07455 [Pseudomonadota bacterium]